TPAEIAAAKKPTKSQKAGPVYWVPKDEAYQGEIDPPHIPPWDQTFADMFPGMPNFRTDYKPLELLRLFNMTAVFEQLKTSNLEEAAQLYRMLLQNATTLTQPGMEIDKARKPTPQEIEKLEAHAVAEQTRIDKGRIER